MALYRIATRSRSWVKIAPKNGVAIAFPLKAKCATAFDTKKLAQALAAAEAKFALCHPPGCPPSISLGCFGLFGSSSAPPMPPAALKLAILASRLEDCHIESFDHPATLASSMALPSFFAIVSARGGFAREGASGYMDFVDKFDEATLFKSAEQAKLYARDCTPCKEDILLMATAKIVELALTPRQSLNLSNLKPSDNDATALMRSLHEKREMSSTSPKPPRRAKMTQAL